MKSLIDAAMTFADGAEALQARKRSSSLTLENGRWEAFAESQDTVYLRTVKDGALAAVSTTELTPGSRERILSSARLLLGQNRRGPRRFAPVTSVPGEAPSVVREWDTQAVLREMQRVEAFVRSRVRDDFSIWATRKEFSREMTNSDGHSFRHHSAVWEMDVSLTDANISRAWTFAAGATPELLSDASLDLLLEMHAALSRPCKIPSGRIPVLFAPMALDVLLSRLQFGTNGVTHALGTSPLKGREGELVLSPEFSLYNDPTEPGFVATTPFDDEGVPTRRLALFENGRFVQPYCDLKYAEALGIAPTGNGFLGGGEVNPLVEHLTMNPGQDSWEALMAKAEGGLLVWGTLGSFTGNVPQGEFSFSVSPGFYVKDGRIAGVAKDVLVSGNVYEVLRNIGGIGACRSLSWTGYLPPLLCNDVSVLQG